MGEKAKSDEALIQNVKAKTETQIKLKQLNEDMNKLHRQRHGKENKVTELYLEARKMEREIADIRRRNEAKKKEAKDWGKGVGTALTILSGPVGWIAEAATDGGVSTALGSPMQLLVAELQGAQERSDAHKQQLKWAQNEMDEALEIIGDKESKLDGWQ